MPSARTPTSRLGVIQKARIATRIGVAFIAVRVGLVRHPLPELTRRLAVPRGADSTVAPEQLGRSAYRMLRLGRRRARCLITSLVLYRLLRREGVEAELVIGLASQPRTKDAHAWIEVDGVDVGPPPGKGNQVELVRYPASDA